MNSLQQIANKIVAQLESGQFKPAAKSARAAFKKHPKEAQFANMAANALASLGQHREAIGYFLKALKLSPDHEELQNNLIQSLILADQREKARELIDRYLPRRTEAAQLHFLRALSYNDIDEPQAVVDAASEALLHAPDLVPALCIRGLALAELNLVDEALEDLEKARILNPTDPNTLTYISPLLAKRLRDDEALKIAQQAVELAPKHMTAQYNLATQLTSMGKFQEARNHFKEVLKLNPTHGFALMELALSQTRDQNEAFLPQLKSALTKTRKGSFDHILGTFGLGNILFQAGDFDAASKQLGQANSLACRLRPYDPETALAEFHRIARHSERLSPSSEQATGPHPIFVLGQPRSGTTLCEMILSAHPDIISCGELEAGPDAMLPYNDEEAVFDAAGFRKQFCRHLPLNMQGASRFVDKMPGNYRFIGYLLAAFPDARIIHISRDPRDVALSMWRNYFFGRWMNFTFSMEGMAHHANLYRRFMNLWTERFPDQILTMDYAEVVADVEQASRRMAEYCNLEWQPQMAAPQDNTAAVRTASLAQVRQGVHQKSVGGWKRMELALAPFNTALDPSLWPELDL